MKRDEFLKEIDKLGITLNERQLNQLEKFYKLLIEWNQKINLTTIISEEEVYLKHFYDSLTLVKEINLDQKLKLCDVGSGAGFPGIVLKICFPKLEIVLVEALQKRVNYLNDIIKKIGLTDIVAIHARMEDFSRINEEKFDMITARAVANLNVLLEISVRALKIKGQMIFMKANCEEEINHSRQALNKLSCNIVHINKFKLPIENSNRTIITVVKQEKTKNIYPRTIDKIKKNPL